LQLVGHHIGGALFLVAQFGVGVDVAADLLDFALQRNNRVDQFHGVLLARVRTAGAPVVPGLPYSVSVALMSVVDCQSYLHYMKNVVAWFGICRNEAVTVGMKYQTQALLSLRCR
jgi:hypothetical protein